MACQLMPEYGDAWKRRGQARSALGENEGALEVCSAVKRPQALQLHLVHCLGPLSCWALSESCYAWRVGMSDSIKRSQQAFPGMLCILCPAGGF